MVTWCIPHIYNPQASSDLDSQIVYTQNTPHIHDLYITYTYVYIFIYLSQSSRHTLIVQLPLLFAQKGQPRAGQCSLAALYGHKMPPPRCALCRARHPSCVSVYSLCLTTTISVTSVSRMAQTPCAGALGEASLRVLERLPCAT